MGEATHTPELAFKFVPGKRLAPDSRGLDVHDRLALSIQRNMGRTRDDDAKTAFSSTHQPMIFIVTQCTIRMTLLIGHRRQGDAICSKASCSGELIRFKNMHDDEGCGYMLDIGV